MIGGHRKDPNSCRDKTRWVDEPLAFNVVMEYQLETHQYGYSWLHRHDALLCSGVYLKPKPATNYLSRINLKRVYVYLFSQSTSLRVLLSLTWRRASTALKTWRDSPGYHTHLRKHVLFRTRYVMHTVNTICVKSLVITNIYSTV